jgi:hypothetical protein
MSSTFWTTSAGFCVPWILTRCALVRLSSLRSVRSSVLEKEYGASVHVYGFQITSVKPDSITLEIDMEISTEARSKAFVELSK